MLKIDELLQDLYATDEDVIIQLMMQLDPDEFVKKEDSTELEHAKTLLYEIVVEIA